MSQLKDDGDLIKEASRPKAHLQQLSEAFSGEIVLLQQDSGAWLTAAVLKITSVKVKSEVSAGQRHNLILLNIFLFFNFHKRPAVLLLRALSPYLHPGVDWEQLIELET